LKRKNRWEETTNLQRYWWKERIRIIE
jgi:hypothetical protein